MYWIPANIGFGVSKLPIINSKTFELLLLSLGFEIKRQKGSHVFYQHPDGRYTTLPHHKGTDISRSLTRAILRQIDLTPEEFIELLGKL
ncbi:type II toxin-antitoxin system HicA family toxin [Imperialibacter sp.]|uniref:type II toxin-antitoxin system HicA family toxin n=1 Tax=Imperialibacter sp. TaxID=2038411 RepID=UPI0032EBA7E8